MATTTFDRFRTCINYNVGKVLNRSDFWNQFGFSKLNDSTTIDNYRRMLTILGYLKVIKRGEYLVEKSIPTHLSMNAMKKIAYPAITENKY